MQVATTAVKPARPFNSSTPAPRQLGGASRGAHLGGHVHGQLDRHFSQAVFTQKSGQAQRRV